MISTTAFNLGMREDFESTLDAALANTIAKIEAADLAKPIRRMRKENPRMSDAEAALAELEYRQFLVLAAVCPEPFSPSALADQLWHAHLTYSYDYRVFCLDLFGEYLDHEPFEHEDHEEAILDQAKLNANQKSRDLHYRVFGVYPVFNKKCCCKKRASTTIK